MPEGLPQWQQDQRTGYHTNANMVTPWWSSEQYLWRPIESVVNPTSTPCFWDDLQTRNVDGGWPHNPPDSSHGSWYNLGFRHPSGSANVAMLGGNVKNIRELTNGNSLDYPENDWDVTSRN